MKDNLLSVLKRYVRDNRSTSNIPVFHYVEEIVCKPAVLFIFASPYQHIGTDCDLLDDGVHQDNALQSSFSSFSPHGQRYWKMRMLQRFLLPFFH